MKPQPSHEYRIDFEAISGHRPQKAIEAISARRKAISMGEGRSDGRRLGLVIEGGGMRGVCSAGGAVALAQLGLSEVFDYVFVTSAAVMNASYFISNQPYLGLSVYLENCRTSHFLNPWRFWKILDVDYIVDQVVTVQKPVNTEAILFSPSNLVVAVMDAATAEPVYIDVKETCADLKSVFRAAMAIPVLYNRSVLIDGQRCIDGGLAVPFPIERAIDLGCTDILCLLTRPENFYDNEESHISRFAFSALAARGNNQLQEVYDSRKTACMRCRDLACGRSTDGSDSPNIASVCTTAIESIVTRTTTDIQYLLPATESYWNRVVQLFGQDLGEFRSHANKEISSLHDYCFSNETPI